MGKALAIAVERLPLDHHVEALSTGGVGDLLDSSPAVGSICPAPIRDPVRDGAPEVRSAPAEPPMVAAAIAQRRPIGSLPMTATSSLASIPSATAAL
jgi:hypothetical protein